MGLNLLNKLRYELEDIAQVDQEPSLEGAPAVDDGFISSKEK